MSDMINFHSGNNLQFEPMQYFLLVRNRNKNTIGVRVYKYGVPAENLHFKDKKGVSYYNSFLGGEIGRLIDEDSGEYLTNAMGTLLGVGENIHFVYVTKKATRTSFKLGKDEELISIFKLLPAGTKEGAKNKISGTGNCVIFTNCARVLFVSGEFETSLNELVVIDKYVLTGKYVKDVLLGSGNLTKNQKLFLTTLVGFGNSVSFTERSPDETIVQSGGLKDGEKILFVLEVK